MPEALTSNSPGVTRGKGITSMPTPEGWPSNYHSFACGYLLTKWVAGII